MILPQGKQIISLGEESYLDTDHEILVKDNLHCSLSRLEFRLIYCLATRAGEIVSPKELINFTWMKSEYVDPQVLYVYINRIRRKIEDNPKSPECIIAIPKVGYMFIPRRKKYPKKTKK
ncbi:winged helix-turn-helix domain-containing protein [Paenibacillus puerhi]|uniref:winged helix-turn-helix domain-containing protein n=1 Tax=Paenibacillus puerhi TaxID=2692622 RepID=UPI001357FD54|nr:helix-turn-helix domain-containing protein [Paenibacillus puerhi]